MMAAVSSLGTSHLTRPPEGHRIPANLSLRPSELRGSMVSGPAEALPGDRKSDKR